MHAQRIHQLQVVFAPEEDRLQLRINTQARTEFRFWLTRRFVKRLWPGLVQAMESRAAWPAAVPPPVDPTARATILEFAHQKAIAQADFSTQFLETPSETPLGPLPILVTRARIEPREQGGHMVSFHPEGSYGIEVAMDPRLLHSFCKLLADAVSKADWDLSLPSSVRKELSDVGGQHPPAGYTIN
ncbi:MAG: hypothetical protein H7836_06130 [Magnetococcus sp. YQC-3]